VLCLAPSGHLTADKRENKDFAKFAYWRTSSIRKQVREMGTSGKTAFDTGLGLSGRKKFCFSPCFARQGRCLRKAIREAGSGRRQRKTTEGAEVQAPTRLGGGGEYSAFWQKESASV